MILQKLIRSLQTGLPATRAGNRIYESLYKYIGANVPILINDNQQEYLEKAFILNSQVYSIVNRIAERQAQIPHVLYEVTDTKQALKYYSLNWQEKREFKAYAKKALKEIDSHQILETLKQPNDMMTGFDFMEGLAVYLMMNGNGFIYGFAPDEGVNVNKWIELALLPSQHMQIIGGTWKSPVAGYKLQFDYEIILEKERVTHIKKFNPLFSMNGTQLYGLSPMAAGRYPTAESSAGYQTSISYYQNQGAKGILTKSASSNQNLTEPQLTQLQELYNRKYKGINKAGDIMVTSASVDWKEIGLSPVDLAILSSRQYSFRELCNIWGAPSAVFNDVENRAYASMNEAKKDMITNAVLPKQRKIYDGLNSGFVASHNGKIGGKKYLLDYDVNQIPELQEDLEKQVNQLNTAWWLTPNEKRFAMGYEDSDKEEFNDFFIPANLTQLGQQEVGEEEAANVIRLTEEARRTGSL